VQAAESRQEKSEIAVSLVEYAWRKKLYDPIAHALASTLNYEKSQFDKLVACLLPLMEKLTTGRTASLLSPELDDPPDWRLAPGVRLDLGDLSGRDHLRRARRVPRV